VQNLIAKPQRVQERAMARCEEGRTVRLWRFPVSLIFLISVLPLIAYVRDGQDAVIPEFIQWLVVPAYLATYMVSMLGLRAPWNYAGAFCLCVDTDYIIWKAIASIQGRSVTTRDSERNNSE
jgi:hypothetical protein